MRNLADHLADLHERYRVWSLVAEASVEILWSNLLMYGRDLSGQTVTRTNYGPFAWCFIAGALLRALTGELSSLQAVFLPDGACSFETYYAERLFLCRVTLP